MIQICHSASVGSAGRFTCLLGTKYLKMINMMIRTATMIAAVTTIRTMIMMMILHFFLIMQGCILLFSIYILYKSGLRGERYCLTKRVWQNNGLYMTWYTSFVWSRFPRVKDIYLRNIVFSFFSFLRSLPVWGLRTDTLWKLFLPSY